MSNNLMCKHFLRTESCPACNQTKSRSEIKEEWAGMKPRIMDMVWNGFNERDWHEAYEVIANHHPDDVQNKATPLLRNFNELKYYEQMAETSFPITEGKMLEIGAHWGRFCFYKMNTTDMEIHGTDAAQTKVDYLDWFNTDIKFYKMLAETLDFEDETFDVVYAFETLEHVGDLNKSLSNIHRVLKPGGALIFSVPLNDFANSGFHTQQHSGEFWYSLMDKYFKIERILKADNKKLIVGKVVKE